MQQQLVYTYEPDPKSMLSSVNIFLFSLVPFYLKCAWQCFKNKNDLKALGFILVALDSLKNLAVSIYYHGARKVCNHEAWLSWENAWLFVLAYNHITLCTLIPLSAPCLFKPPRKNAGVYTALLFLCFTMSCFATWSQINEKKLHDEDCAAIQNYMKLPKL